ncbi:MAG: arsenite efflux transporter metallochaperone ArsD [Kiritimatiellia bacterium]
MTKLEVYDPPMCCSSGVCGLDVDPDVTRFAAELDKLKRQGVAVSRYNLAQEPLAFAGNEAVWTALQEDERCLPLVFLDGQVLSRGKYPPPGMLAAVMAEQWPDDDDDLAAPDYRNNQPGKEAVHVA